MIFWKSIIDNGLNKSTKNRSFKGAMDAAHYKEQVSSTKAVDSAKVSTVQATSSGRFSGLLHGADLARPTDDDLTAVERVVALRNPSWSLSLWYSLLLDGKVLKSSDGQSTDRIYVSNSHSLEAIQTSGTEYISNKTSEKEHDQKNTMLLM